ncbi:MAG TPA: pyridoxal phosphate-dependent aminotransferase [Casimicrobium huifangae]|jgi:aspartate/methionine/tyrosine aminotransferase|uniref:pyridoxal phosphate-dependent aminotransferase n=1 Tax=Casimicrobium huifangae TaxID=2591109 RepID=UPI0012EBDF77|nr:pyridoxal phosphate-dependent aminotransferase [Casimicrobium huifangae]HOB00586.1 pyridoxal phosphate-dependent aminotransferase [Casimicrobium huifangae]HQA33485.1 pyridoxal phosphate-dependent aminotransferase [Casimicrobium huifangae]HQD65087.1 pyridoxal phosphate-dependent aminotransferase [Casimicrobium huifangae]
MTPAIAARLSQIEPFHVMEIATHARALEAQGRDVIHMEIGEPDFPTPQPVIDAAQSLLASGQIYYTSALGIRALREAISGHYRRLHGLDIAPERIIVTAGGSAALLLTCALLVGRDDEILLTDPSYPCNRHFVRVMEGVPRTLPVGPDDAYQFTAAMIDRAWGRSTKGVLVASPSNPTGTSLHEGELKRIVDCVAAHGGLLISDETYAGLNYGRPPETALAHSDDAFVVSSFSKYWNMTGWRLGWLVAPERHVRDLEKLAQNLYISPAALSQHAALACFSDAAYAIAEARRAEFQARRDYFATALGKIGFKIPILPDGGFFVYADVSAFTRDSEKFASEMLDRTGVAFAPGIDFGEFRAREHVRMAYAVNMAKLQDGVARLAGALA